MEEGTRKARELIDAAHNLKESLRFWARMNYAIGSGWEMAPNPEPGDDEVSMSDMDLRRHSWDSDSEGAEYVALPFTAWGDYVGSDYSRSNERSLWRDYPDTFIRSTGYPGAVELLIPADADIDENLFDILVQLADEYPVYDESDMSALESEVFDEDLASWIIPDIRNSIDDEFLDTVTDDEITAAIFRWMEEAGEYPQMETAVNCYFDNDKFVKWFAPDHVIER
jgi:hypothetical protein